MPLARLIRILTLFALLVAPLGMMGSHAAAASPIPMPAGHGAHAAPAAPEHCAPAPAGDRDHRQQSIDCMIFCAAMAAPGADLARGAVFAALALDGHREPLHRGLHPEFEPPPPRTS